MMTTDEIMALADECVAAAAREGYMPGGFLASKEALRSAIEALQADARRWIKVREYFSCCSYHYASGYSYATWWIPTDRLYGATAEAAIDAAMALDKP